MKKLLAILLATTMLLMAIPALAEGNTTDKAITFMNFNYGDTFGNIRSSERIYTIGFKTEMLSPRNLAEAFWRVAEWSQVSDTQPVCFDAMLSGHEVAGYRCNPLLFFVYPVENGRSVINEAEATFYAGEYEFQDGDAKAIFDDLKQKLIEKGVPEKEVAFIHDANTEAKKTELFGKVKSGQVRFLIGSTAKMGAGTNVRATCCRTNSNVG